MAELLNKSVTVTAPASGEVSATLGPDSSKGPPRWRITRYAVRNETLARRGQPPIPTCNVYTDSERADQWIDGTYDGSFDGGDCDITISRGQVLLAVWAGAQSGDRLTLSVSGEVLR